MTEGSDLSGSAGSSERPLSPHLGIYRFSWLMLMSIFHRLTGLASVAFYLLLIWWFFCLYDGKGSYDIFVTTISNPLGMAALFFLHWNLMHHLFGGLRHFVWDGLYFLDVERARLLAILTPVLSFCSVVLVWVVVWFRFH